MSELLLLPAPKKPKPRRKLFLAVFSVCLALVLILLYTLLQKPQILANITFENFQAQMQTQQESALDSLLLSKNKETVEIRVGGKLLKSVSLSELGIQYTWESPREDYMNEPIVSSFLEPLDSSLMGSAENGLDSLYGQLTINRSRWNSFLRSLAGEIDQAASLPSIEWSAEKGWHLEKAKKGMGIDPRSIDESLVKLVSHLQNNYSGAQLDLRTKIMKPRFSAKERRRIKRLYKRVKKLSSSPVLLQIGDDEITLDLNADEDFLSIRRRGVILNQDKIRSFIDSLAMDYNRAAGRVRIVGREEVRPGVFKAVTEGDFVEGQRINTDEVYDQIMQALGTEERTTIEVRLYELPVKVYSELEGTEYELLSVGYSEYSTGNAANRVHNIKTGLSRINGTLIDPGQEISFNRSTGTIDNEFKMGWAIFGPVAKPSLGGGICQVSTTFYRSLLNLGVPIVQRQNHSWDLSYYQKGGYGLDATIYPAVGLDVKGLNDLASQIFIYSYTRPETEEAFVLFYGKGDGRKITLEADKEYIPYRGAKTLYWTQTIEFQDGTVKKHRIKSRYRS